MSKKTKFQLNDLKVQSFVTETEKKNLKGGLPYTCNTCDVEGCCSITYIWACSDVQTCIDCG